MKNSIKLGLLAAGVLLSQQAQAVLLPPNSSGIPEFQPLPSTPPSSIIATVTDSFAIGGFTGSVKTDVYAPQAGYLLGGYTFVYQISIDSVTSGQELSSFGVNLWEGSAAYAAQAGFPGGTTALLAKRDSGDNITFFFTDVATDGLKAGGASTFLILSTDALNYEPSAYGVQAGLTDNGISLAPAPGGVTVPDGSTTLAIMGIGFLALQGFRRVVTA